MPAQMAFLDSFCLFMLFFAGLICSSRAYNTVEVGDKDGWVLTPSENYSHWAERLRFQVNDTLLFKYKKGTDSVLVVNKDDHNKCNTDNPILKLDGGDSEFKFNRSGPFFFISGNKTNCDNGQKLIIVVLAVRKAHPPSSPSPSTGAGPPGQAGHAPSPAPGAPTPGPLSPSPTASSPAPKTSPPAPTVSSPVPAPATSPSGNSPTGSPSPSSETPVTPAPSASSPTGTGSSTPTASNTPADERAPSPAPSSAPRAFTPTVVLVSSVSLVLSVALGGFIISP